MVPNRVGPWRPNVRAGRTGGQSTGLVRGHGLGPSLVVPRAASVSSGGPHREGKCADRDGDVLATSDGQVHMYGAKFAGAPAPRVRPGRTVHATRPRRPDTRARAGGRGPDQRIRPRVWQSRAGTVRRSKRRTDDPCPLDGTDQRARTSLPASVEPARTGRPDGDRPVSSRSAPPGIPVRWRRPAMGRRCRGGATAATPPELVRGSSPRAHDRRATVSGRGFKDGIEPSGP